MSDKGRPVLLVEDNPAVGLSLVTALGLEGFEVTWAQSLAEARRALVGGHFELVLLDVGLPDGNGIDFCRHLRASGETFPILFVTACSDEESAVRGLAVGADDYVRKPFGTRELIARLRRCLGSQKGTVVRGSLHIDADERVVVASGRGIPLTGRQFEMLLLLARRPGHVVTREALLRAIDPGHQLSSRTVDSHVSHLRARLRKAGVADVDIASVPGDGYRLLLRG